MKTLSTDRARGMALHEIAPLVLGMNGFHRVADRLGSGAMEVGTVEASHGARILAQLRSQLAGTPAAEVIDSVIAALQATDPRPKTKEAAEGLERVFGEWVLKTSGMNAARGARGDGDRLIESMREIRGTVHRAMAL